MKVHYSNSMLFIFIKRLHFSTKDVATRVVTQLCLRLFFVLGDCSVTLFEGDLRSINKNGRHSLNINFTFIRPIFETERRKKLQKNPIYI